MKLSYQSRKHLSKKSFAFPGMRTKDNPAGRGAYPIPDIEHGRAALRYGARFLSKEDYAKLRRKVLKKFPTIESLQKSAKGK
jgi:hypothetical protein